MARKSEMNRQSALVYSTRDEFQHEMQKSLILLCHREEAMLQHDYAGMIHDTDYLKLAIFEALVLQNLLYRHLCLIETP